MTTETTHWCSYECERPACIRARELLAQQYDECDPDYAQALRNGEDLHQDDTIALRAIAAALSQQQGQTVRDARQIIDEFIQCAAVGRPHGKLIAQARDWLAFTAAQQSAAVVDGYDPNELLRCAMTLIRRGHSIASDPGDEVLVQRIADHLAAITGERNG